MARTQKNRKPIAVVISDVHFNLSTIEVASKCLRQALEKAKHLSVPLVISGDLHDTKANLRGECIKAILDCIEGYREIKVIVGNHDKINEKSQEHALEFLRGHAHIISKPVYDDGLKAHLIPYFDSADTLRLHLKTLPKGSRIIMHQGYQGALPGGYAYDKSALQPDDCAPFQIISGHYHESQTINNFTFVGNPYTLDFSEFKHPVKGFMVLFDDFSFERHVCNVRRHVIIEQNVADLKDSHIQPDAILLVRIQGASHELEALSKDFIAKKLNIAQNFRLDLIPTDKEKVVPKAAKKTAQELFDQMVDSEVVLSFTEKQDVKRMYRKYLQ